MISSNQDQLIIPNQCTCQFQHDTSAYYGTLLVQNPLQKTIYYHITSTFAHHFKVFYNPGSLKPRSIFQIKFKITPTNQIGNEGQKLFFSYSNQKLGSLCTCSEGSKKAVDLKFSQTFVENEEINQILLQDCKEIEKQASNLFNEGYFTKCKNKYEEAFLLYRRNYRPIYGKALSNFMLKEWKESLQNVSLFLHLAPDDLEGLLLRANTLEQIGNTEKGLNKLLLVRQGIVSVKNVLKRQNIKKGMKIKGQKMLTRLERIKEELSALQNQHNFQNLMSKAVEKYDSQIKQYFPNQDSLKNYLDELLSNEDKEIQQTPQYCLDPINYEIYLEPVIVPNGNSYQKSFLLQYFKVHGSKDPFTRQFMNMNQVFPNHSLKILVRNNPSLHKWLKYEKEVARF